MTKVIRHPVLSPKEVVTVSAARLVAGCRGRVVLSLLLPVRGERLVLSPVVAGLLR
jgi:hypothetical protein